MQRARFITFEGIEGSGKSTQLARVADALRAQGRTVTVSREPGGTALGDAIRTLLLDPRSQGMTPTTEILLYAASRAQHVAEVIQPALARGEIVLVDRFIDSTRAYQGAARAIDPGIVQALEQIATDGLLPDRTIVFDLPVQIGLQRVSVRGAQDRLERETVDFHERVRQGYLALARAEPQRVVVVDATREADAVFADVWQMITQSLSS